MMMTTTTTTDPPPLAPISPLNPISVAGSEPISDVDPVAAWRGLIRWISDLLLLVPCRPVAASLPLLLRAPPPASVTGTILCPLGTCERRAVLCFQPGPIASSPAHVLDLPLGTCELAGACRVALECGKGEGEGELMSARTWAVCCNGRRAGFGTRRAATGAETAALAAIGGVSAGAGIFPAAVTGGGGGYAYLRGRYERVVGSADAESYHLVSPPGCGEQELSFFFMRV